MGKKRRRKKPRRLDVAIAAIHRRYGPSSLIKGGPAETAGPAPTVPHIPTGFYSLDRALTIGGLPKGRVCEVLGPATSGKTTLALKFLVQAQADDREVAYVDQALYFDPDYAHRCGLDLSRLLVGRPEDVQEALAMTESLARNGELSAVVFDVLDFVWTDPLAASHLAATLNRLPAFLARSGTILLVLHESAAEGSLAAVAPRDGVAWEWRRVASEWGSALAHAATVRLRVVREEWLRQHKDIRGYRASVQVLKNKLGPAGRTASITIEFNGTVRGNGL